MRPVWHASQTGCRREGFMTCPQKLLIHPDRLRRIPNSFSWLDRRFLSDGYLERLSGEAALLYFFLAMVSDRNGVSFYGDRRTSKLLQMTCARLDCVRGELIQEGLIAYRPPFYQVLALPMRTSLITNSKRTPKGPIQIGTLIETPKDRNDGRKID